MNLKDISWPRIILGCLLGISVGFLIVLFPVFAFKGSSGSLVARMDKALMTMSVVQMLLQLAAGVLWGMVLRWPYAICAAISGVACLPVIVVMKITEDPTAHNLWPFEFVFYAVLAVFAGLAAGLGVLLKKLFRARARTVSVGS